MGPKKRSHKVIDIDEYTSVQPNRWVSQHSSYEMQGRPRHSFIPLPATTPIFSPDSLIPPIIPNINDDTPFEDDEYEYSNREEDFREMEAMGFSGTLTQSDEAIDSSETRKCQRSQAVGQCLFLEDCSHLFVIGQSTFTVGTSHRCLCRWVAKLEGLGDFSAQLVCAGLDCEVPIGHPEPTFRCRDCLDVQLYCTKCVVTIHKTHPFHRIQVSNFIEFVFSWLLINLSH